MEILMLTTTQQRNKRQFTQSKQCRALFNDDIVSENELFLTRQLITYLGNKRSLLDFVGQAVNKVKKQLGKEKLDLFDVFSGSGVVARYFKQHAGQLYVNDLENYTAVINRCYLANKNEIDLIEIETIYEDLITRIESNPLKGGIVRDLYAPKDEENIQVDDRCFYTVRNAMYIDTMRTLIDSIPPHRQHFFLAPLLSEVSVHSNTSGVFKGFYKNKETGIGQYGGKNQDALLRIKGEIMLPFPVFSNFSSGVSVHNTDSNKLIKELPEVDLAYLDPPYNQHPYGSNYFMLNLVLDYKRPESASKISGIPDNWNRSPYNKPQFAYEALRDLVENIKAKYVLISFNSEGFIKLDEMKTMLNKIGKVEVLETNYNTFRGCRNLRNREIHVSEYLYLVEK
ncbi:MAG: DNA adenine methylase [Planctomycetaceae bacterium]|jgi:adenine-specific DNA-methyltransferase|nr:DNA adenine methylase [Planctomycetaceae bacterium]